MGIRRRELLGLEKKKEGVVPLLIDPRESRGQRRRKEEIGDERQGKSKKCRGRE